QDGGHEGQAAGDTRQPGRGEQACHLEESLLQPAVDDDRLAADVARALGGEKADDVAELLRLAPPAQRDVGQLLLLRAFGVQLLEARGRDAARCDTVDRDAAPTKL